MRFFRSRRLYLDYASATPVRAEALRALARAARLVGNPGAIHAEGVAAQQALDDARARIARELGCKPREIVFTSGATEANNLAILGLARRIAIARGGLNRTRWVVSSIEHPSVLECFMEIERLGGTVVHVDPDRRGRVHVEDVVSAATQETVLVSVGWANSEIGTIQPIRDIARALRDACPDALLHADAGQAPLYLSPQAHTLEADLVTFDSGKLYGPRGVGALYLSGRAALAPHILGGGQERGLRAGTENLALAAGFAEALARAGAERAAESARLRQLRDAFIRRIRAAIPEAEINGDERRSLPNIVNISIPGIDSEYVTLALDARGIAIATKSACREGENRRSHVVDALFANDAGLRDEAWRAETTLRFSFGRDTGTRSLARAAEELARAVARSKA